MDNNKKLPNSELVSFNEKEMNNSAKQNVPKVMPKYLINRDVLTQEAVIKQSGYESRDKSFPYAIRKCWSEFSFLRMFTGLIPVIEWLPKYSIKNYLIGDIIAGITVAVMHIPQGMAYGILAGVTANVGLYMAFFPVLTYFLLGTSRHISIGTFAVVSLMTLNVVQTYATIEEDSAGDKSFNNTLNNVNTIDLHYTPMEVVTATAIAAGCIHLLMYVFRLGILSVLLSEPLVSGFTTAAAVHVVVTQFIDVLGLTIVKHKGAFKIIRTLKDIFTSMENTNIATLILSTGIVIFMIIMNELVKPYLAKKCRFPIPAELIAVLGGNLISKFLEIGPEYNVRLVGEIPAGLPVPQFPPARLIALVAVDSIAIAIVTYSVVMSMALIFAKKRSYEVSANQELFALGISNLIGGAFSCIPVACSLSRSLIQEQTGGSTQMASIVSSLIILCLLLWIGPFFETLPRCVLAGIIIVALKGMFIQVRHLKVFSKQGKMEVLTWICTFVGVILIDIDYGLFIGILVSVLTLYIKGWKSHGSALGTIPDTGIYVDLDTHKNASEVSAIKIFRYSGSINFATRSSYKTSLYQAIKINQNEIRRRSILDKERGVSESANQSLLSDFRALILDLSAVSHIDVAGCKTLTEIIHEMKDISVRVFVANPFDRVYDTLIHSMALGEGPFEILPSVHDAVLIAKSWQNA